MADQKTSALAAAGALSGSEILPVVQGGTTRKLAATQIKTFVLNGLGVGNLSDFGESVDDRVAVLLKPGAGIQLTYDDATDQLTISVTSSGSLPRSYIAGFNLANNTTDPANYLDVAPGAARDENNGYDLATLSTIVKRIDAVFAEYTLPGTASGGRDSNDNLTGAKWFHVYEIGGAGKNTQPFISTSLSPAMPSGFLYRRRVGSIYWTGSAIRAFAQIGDTFYWAASPEDINTGSLSTTYSSFPLSVPTGVVVEAIAQGVVNCATVPCALFVVRPGDAEHTNNPLARVSVANQATAIGRFTTLTNTSAQIQARGSQVSTTLTLATVGWRDFRGAL